MIKLLVLALVGFVFYMLNRNYKSSDYERIKVDGKQPLKGKLEDHEAGLFSCIDVKSCKSRWEC